MSCAMVSSARCGEQTGRRREVTDDEVQKVAWLLAQADAGCPECTWALAHEAARTWPQFEWVELVERARTEQ